MARDRTSFFNSFGLLPRSAMMTLSIFSIAQKRSLAVGLEPARYFTVFLTSARKPVKFFTRIFFTPR